MISFEKDNDCPGRYILYGYIEKERALLDYLCKAYNSYLNKYEELVIDDEYEEGDRLL